VQAVEAADVGIVVPISPIYKLVELDREPALLAVEIAKAPVLYGLTPRLL